MTEKTKKIADSHEDVWILRRARAELILLPLRAVNVTVEFAGDVHEADVLQRRATRAALEAVTVEGLTGRLAVDATANRVSPIERDHSSQYAAAAVIAGWCVRRDLLRRRRVASEFGWKGISSDGWECMVKRIAY